MRKDQSRECGKLWEDARETERPQHFMASMTDFCIALTCVGSALENASPLVLLVVY